MVWQPDEQTSNLNSRLDVPEPDVPAATDASAAPAPSAAPALSSEVGEVVPSEADRAAPPAASGERGEPEPSAGAEPPASPAPALSESAPTHPAVDDLAAENARLRRELERAQAAHAAQASPRRVRRTAVGVLVVLTCLGMLLSGLTDWAHQELLDTNNWVALVGPLAHDPKVVSAVSVYTADQVVTLLQVQQRVEQALPEQAHFLAVPVTNVIHDFTQKRVANLMRTTQFQRVWIATNRYVHAQVLAALRGQTKNVIISNGTVTLNLIPVIDQALQTVQNELSGLIPGNIKLPDVSQLQVPSQARAKLSQALGVTLPANFGEITLFHSVQLAQAQRLLRLADLLAVLLPIITALLLVATLWLSLDRRRTLIQLGIGVAIVFLLARVTIGYVQDQVVNSITNPTAQGIASDVIPSALSGLLSLTVLLTAAGAATILIAYLVGKPEWFRAGYALGRTGYARTVTAYAHARDEMAKRSQASAQSRAAQADQAPTTAPRAQESAARDRTSTMPPPDALAPDA
jgi:hypothetical protein